jgi:hypothetical protein
MSTEIDELKRLVSEAQKETEDRLKQYSEYGLYIHAKSQLSFIKNKIGKSETVNEEDKKSINIGIMAVKELDASEPEYARLLMKISIKFKEL